MTDGEDFGLLFDFWNEVKYGKSFFSKTKTTFKGRMTTISGKDRRLCKIEANAIIYSSLSRNIYVTNHYSLKIIF